MPLIDEAINPIDESNFGVSGQIPTTPNMPVDISNIDPLGFKDNPGQMVIPNARPINFGKPLTTGKPGFVSTFAHAVWNYNELVNAGKFVGRTVDQMNHLDDEVPEGWDPKTLQAIEGFDQKYWPSIWGAESPKDQQARQEEARNQMKDDQYYSQGSMVANLAGGLVGGITSPSTWLIPMSAGVKYASFSQNILKNVMKSLPAAGLSAVATEGLYQAGHAGGNMEDWAVDSLRDIVFGSALIGGAAGLGHALRGGELYAMKKTTNYASKGVDFKPVIEDGEYKGIRAVGNPQMSANAALVDEAQLFADNTMNRAGVTKYIPYFDFLAGNRFIGSPAIRALRSPYATVSYLFDRLASHGIETKGIAKGQARPMSAEEMLGRTRAEARIFGSAINGLYYEANGLSRSDNVYNAIKNVRQTVSENKRIGRDEFGQAVRSVINTDAQHDIPQVNEAAKLAMEFVGKIGKEFTDAHGWEEGFLSPRTAANYLMQNYHLGQIRSRPEEFINLVADELRKQHELVTELQGPLLRAKQRLADLNETMESSAFMGETRSIANEIAAARGAVRAEQEALTKKLRDNEDYHILLEDRVFLDSAERAELKKILEPQELLRKEHDKMRETLAELKIERGRAKEALRKNRKPETRQKNQKRLEEVEKKIEFQDSTVKALEDKIELERIRLIEEANAETINRKFFTREENDIRFRDPNESPKFRQTYESHGERVAQGRQLRETILGNTAEHLNDTVLGSMLGTVIDSPSSLKARTVMIPSEAFNSNGFLDPDIGKAISAYANTMGRHTSMRLAFKDNVSRPGIQGVLDAMLKEKQKKEAEILAKPDSPERVKEINKHEKEYQKEVKFVRALYDAFMGRSGDPNIRRYTQTLKNYAAATLLGGVPLSQITDLGAIVLKHGLYPFMMQGLRPMLKSLNGTIKSEEGIALKENAAHALVGIQHISGGVHNRFTNSDTMSDVPLYGLIGNAIDKAAHVSGNLYGTNFIENINQSIVANITQSKIMKAAFDYKNGSITEKQIREMAHIGIDIKAMHERFINGYEEASGWKELGGYQSKYYNWKDTGAAEQMSEALYRSVYDTVVQSGMFTSPLWTNNPILGLVFTFHGWAYSAFARYTIPVLQRPDGQAAIGVATMFGLGLLVEPLRQWANGKEVNLDDSHLFAKALDNSGVLSAPSDMLNTLNLLFGNELIPGLASERRKEISVLGAMGGPAIGQFEIGMGVLRDAWTGKISQQTVKNSARLLGLNQHLLLRRPSNQFLQSTGLPERRSQAEPWAWYQAIGGE